MAIARLESILAMAICCLAVVWVVRRIDHVGVSSQDFRRRKLDENRAEALRPISSDGEATASSAAEFAFRERLMPEDALRAVDESADAHTISVPRAASLAELSTLLRLCGADPSDADVTRYRQQLRSAGVQALSLAVLIDIVRQYFEEHPPEQHMAELLEAWAVVDQDGDGVITSTTNEMHHLVQMLTTMGEPLTDDETEEFLREMDADRNGEITKREFMHVLGGDG